MTCYLEIFSLEGCPYSIKAEKLAKISGVAHKVIKVKQTKKDFYKQKNNMNTFPQIFAIATQDNIRKKIGGCDDLINILKRELNNPEMPLSVRNQLIKNL